MRSGSWPSAGNETQKGRSGRWSRGRGPGGRHARAPGSRGRCRSVRQAHGQPSAVTLGSLSISGGAQMGRARKAPWGLKHFATSHLGETHPPPPPSPSKNEQECLPSAHGANRGAAGRGLVLSASILNTLKWPRELETPRRVGRARSPLFPQHLPSALELSWDRAWRDPQLGMLFPTYTHPSPCLCLLAGL